MITLRAFTLLFAALSTQVAGCDSLCANKEVQRITSPSGAWTAVAFTRDCGATTGTSSQVSILTSGASLPDEPGNVLVLEASVPIRLSWSASEELVVAGSRHVKRFKEEARVSGVQVVYP